jgi:glycolate oxidase iron-sulfur subunit
MRDPERVALLRGCVQAGLFGRVNEATCRVLEANGYLVEWPRGQVCCGALHAHAGSLHHARALAKRNVDAFDRTSAEWIGVNAAGCGATMKEYGRLLESDPAYRERAQRFAARVRDLSELLADHGPRAGGTLPICVAYDAPCHLLHAQGVAEAPLEMLRAIPGLALVLLERADECCGGAGIYGVTHAKLGSWIGVDKLQEVESSGADAVATPNPGCIMQIGAWARIRRLDVSVWHPAELLDLSYRLGGLYDRGA